MSEESPVVVEAEGETVGEAKWISLRELERRFPGLDRDLVAFEVVSEGERGLLGVGTSPARVLARFDPGEQRAHAPSTAGGGSDTSTLVREMLEEVALALGADCRVEVEVEGDTVSASLTGPDVAVLIGKHGKTIDSIQYVVGAAVASAGGDASPRVVVDAAGYRDRRETRLAQLADRTAAQVQRTGETVRLEPMSSVERKIVHLRLKDTTGIETHSEGDEPNRYVVVAPASDE